MNPVDTLETVKAVNPLKQLQSLGQSIWLRELHGREEGPPPPVDLAKERSHAEFVRQLVAEGKVSAVHDVSDGGLVVALAEMALAGGIGCVVE